MLSEGGLEVIQTASVKVKIQGSGRKVSKSETEKCGLLSTKVKSIDIWIQTLQFRATLILITADLV